MSDEERRGFFLLSVRDAVVLEEGLRARVHRDALDKMLLGRLQTWIEREREGALIHARRGHP